MTSTLRSQDIAGAIEGSVPMSDLAQAAGLSPEDVAGVIAAGVVTPDEHGRLRPSAITKLRLVTALLEAGLPLDDLASAIRDGRLTFDYVDHLMPSPVRFVSVPSSPSTDHLALLRTILGGFDRDDRTAREDDLAISELVAAAIALGAPIERIVRIVRSTAQSVEHLVALQRDFIDDVLIGPAIEDTGSPVTALAATATTRAEFRDLGRRLVALLLERFADEAIFTNLVQLTELALTEGGVGTPHDGQSVVFVDVSSYTRRSQDEGDDAAAHQALLLADFVHGLAAPLGGRLVRSLGDGALAHFPDPASAVRFALDAVSLAPANGIWNLHAGVNSGPMLRRDGDYYGTAVNIASRVADHARQDQVVVTRAVVEALQEEDGTMFTPIGSVALKNVAEPIELFLAGAVS